MFLKSIVRSCFRGCSAAEAEETRPSCVMKILNDLVVTGGDVPFTDATSTIAAADAQRFLRAVQANAAAGVDLAVVEAAVEAQAQCCCRGSLSTTEDFCSAVVALLDRMAGLAGAPEALRAASDALPDDLPRVAMHAAARLIPHAAYLGALLRGSPEAHRAVLSEALATTASALGVRSGLPDAWRLPEALPADMWGYRAPRARPRALLDNCIAPFVAHKRYVPSVELQRSEDVARKRFEEYTDGLLKDVLVPGGPWVAAGGMPAFCVRGGYPPVPGDVDLFLVGVGTAEDATAALLDAVRKILRALKAWCRSHPSREDGEEDTRQLRVVSLLTPGAFTLMANSSGPDTRSRMSVKIQFVLRIYPDVGEVLHTFDMGSCRVAFDGERFRAAPTAMFALRHGVNLADPLNLTIASRCNKYQERGFVYLVPTWPEMQVRIEAVLGSVFRDSDGAFAKRAIGEGGLKQILAWNTGVAPVLSDIPESVSNMQYNYISNPAMLFDPELFATFCHTVEFMVTDDGRRKYLATSITIASEAIKSDAVDARVMNDLVPSHLREEPARWRVDRPGARVAANSCDTFYNV